MIEAPQKRFMQDIARPPHRPFNHLQIFPDRGSLLVMETHRDTQKNSPDSPTLDAPGGGLRLPELLLARYYYFPKLCRSLTWDSALDLFRSEGNKICKLIENLDSRALGTRVLVSGVRGIEDSSRYWSPAMAVEHLEIVGDGIVEIVTSLSQNRKPNVKVDIARVKPRVTSASDRLQSKEMIQKFQAFLGRYETKISSQLGDKKSKLTHLHPWFKQLNAFQWHCLAASHQGIHRRQIVAILKK